MFLKHFKFLNELSSIIFPSCCLSCNAYIEKEFDLCFDCKIKLNFITNDYCGCCGYPFDISVGTELLCGKCLAKKPDFNLARSVFTYDTIARELILKLKHNNIQDNARFLAQQMIRVIHDNQMNDIDYIIPVPSHIIRILLRGYNPMAVVAHHLANEIKINVMMRGLKRIKFGTQKNLSQKQRIDFMKNAFVVNPKKADFIKNKNILLIDDVMTTSATIHSCTRALKKANVGKIYIVTLARACLRRDKTEIDF